MKDKEKQIEICENCKIKENCSHRILIHMEKCKVNDCDYFQNISTDKEKQIEEMAQCKNSYCFICSECSLKGGCDRYILAKELYEQGYRKLPENAFILTDDNAEELANLIVTSPQMQSVMSNLIKAWQKETAEKIFAKLMEKVGFWYGRFVGVGKNEIIELAKEQFGVEIKE